MRECNGYTDMLHVRVNCEHVRQSNGSIRLAGNLHDTAQLARQICENSEKSNRKYPSEEVQKYSGPVRHHIMIKNINCFFLCISFLP